jgi:hypothetical protein
VSREESTVSRAEGQQVLIPSLTPREAYLAMYYFVDAYWERGGKRDGNVMLLRKAMMPFNDQPNPDTVATDDPAFWDDWLTAIEKARTQGLPEELAQ